MRLIDWLSTAILFLLGCVHNFVAAPMTYEALSTTALWFVTGGLALWYAAFVNALWLRRRGDRIAVLLAAATNLTFLVFAFAFVAVKGSWSDPQNILLIAPTAWLAARVAFAGRR